MEWYLFNITFKFQGTLHLMTFHVRMRILATYIGALHFTPLLIGSVVVSNSSSIKACKLVSLLACSSRSCAHTRSFLFPRKSTFRGKNPQFGGKFRIQRIHFGSGVEKIKRRFDAAFPGWLRKPDPAFPFYKVTEEIIFRLVFFIGEIFSHTF